MSTVIILIDASYFCFHRYFSLIKWWKSAHSHDKIDLNENPILNQEFVDKYKKTFIEKINEIPKKLKLNKDIDIIFIAAKDCKRNSIWRNDIHNSYKQNRKANNGVGPFFKLVYEENLFEKAGIKNLLYLDKLEADDCIALFCKEIKHINKYIITSDCDYLQLNSDNTHLFDLSYKNLNNSKSFSGNPEYDLKLKIIMGDKADNIPPIYKKCGVKTAKKLIENDHLLQEKLSNNNIKNQYILNEKLISFEHIPSDLILQFKSKYSAFLKSF